ncbi:ubiquitin carboxyl-terminal hydrolase MINDY-1/2, partial [Tremellales sp. Uapishka_1]
MSEPPPAKDGSVLVATLQRDTDHVSQHIAGEEDHDTDPEEQSGVDVSSQLSHATGSAHPQVEVLPPIVDEDPEAESEFYTPRSSQSLLKFAAAHGPALTEPAPLSHSGSRTPQPPPEGQGLWQLKEIPWPDPRVGGERRTARILMQSANGPCSLIALANVLILRGSIHLSDPYRVSYDSLVSHIADFLLSRPAAASSTSMSISSALEILPTMTSHLHLDISFSDIHSFLPSANSGGGELAVFRLCGVDLVHGWVADMQSPEYEVVSSASTFETAQERVVQGMEAEGATSGASQTAIKDGRTLQQFLESSATQLTYAGLFALSTKLEPGSLAAFFRNSHLNVLYRRPASPESEAPEDDPVLYQLVTDSSFSNEPEVVWESLVDLDGNAASFVNGEFHISRPSGGEYAGGANHDADAQLAKHLQEEEDMQSAQQHQDAEDGRTRARREENRNRKSKKERERERDPSTAGPSSTPQPGKEKKKKDCIIM